MPCVVMRRQLTRNITQNQLTKDKKSPANFRGNQQGKLCRLLRMLHIFRGRFKGKQTQITT
jgi:hypothetical protein